MKPGKLGVITLLLFGMVIGLTGIMCADQPVPAVPETQTLGTVTTADVVGIAMETDAGAWTLTNSGETMYTVTATSTSDVVKILNDDEITHSSLREEVLSSYRDPIAPLVFQCQNRF